MGHFAVLLNLVFSSEACVYVLPLFDEPIHIDLIEALRKGERAAFLKDKIPSTILQPSSVRYWATQVVERQPFSCWLKQFSTTWAR